MLTGTLTLSMPVFWALSILLAALPVVAKAGMSPEEVAKFNEYKINAERTDTSGDFGPVLKALAQIQLGVLYSKGEGVAKNQEQAFFWFHKAAVEGGQPLAQAMVGDCYFSGQGVKKDFLNLDNNPKNNFLKNVTYY